VSVGVAYPGDEEGVSRRDSGSQHTASGHGHATEVLLDHSNEELACTKEEGRKKGGGMNDGTGMFTVEC